MLVQHFTRNVFGRDFVVGDIHGRFVQLYQQLRHEWDFNPNTDRLFATGDLISDDVVGSRDILDWIFQPWFHSVLGNRDEVLAQLQFMDPLLLERWQNVTNLWFGRLLPSDQIVLCERFQALPTAIDVETSTGKIGILHGECPFKNWQDLVNLFSRRGYEPETLAYQCRNSRKQFKNPDGRFIQNIDEVYFGHNPVPQLFRRFNQTYIDTAHYNPHGRFTILPLE